MNSNEIFEALEFIKGDPSSNAKVEYLKEFLEDDEFRKVVQLAYNPFVTFGLKGLNLEGGLYGKGIFCDSTYDILDQLSSREMTGNQARDTVWIELSNMTEQSVKLFKMILNGNLEAGFHLKTINKARKGTIPEMCYMRCSLPSAVNIESWDWERGVISQVKADGLFANLTIKGGVVTLHTRKGQPFPMLAFSEIASALKSRQTNDVQFHGELLVKRNGKFLSRKAGNGVLNSIRLGGEWELRDVPYFVAWDMITLDELTEKKGKSVYDTRFAFVLFLCNEGVVNSIESRKVHSIGEAQAHYREMRALGLEGTVVKSWDGIWKDGTSKNQVKFKDEKPCDLRVLSMNEGTGKNKELFGSLTCMSECSHLVVSVSGFTDAKRKEIFDNWDAWQHSIIHVRYNELIQDAKGKYSLFLPRFDGEAFDKSEADSLKRIIEENA